LSSTELFTVRKRIIENLKNLNLRNQAIMMLAIRYGLRDSDICNLKLEDIDWYADTINTPQRALIVSHLLS
jgi:integrase